MSIAPEPDEVLVPADELAELANLGRDMGVATVMFHSRVAERLGLSVTDHKCLDLAMRADGPLTAGRIAELSGLSTGAVTGVIDRLERAGYVRRVRDPHDRRKVLVEVAEVDPAKLASLVEGLHDSLRSVIAHYTAAEREVIKTFLVRMAGAVREQTTRLAE